jgi:hypothetical protein
MAIFSGRFEHYKKICVKNKNPELNERKIKRV